MGDGSTRFAGRILLFDRRGSILLFLEEFPDSPGQPRWITPGGGVDPGETAAEAARRELFEETGLVVEDLGPIVHTTRFEVDRPSARHSFAHWDFFVHVVDAPFAPSREHWTQEELVTVRDVRWWSIDDLVTSGERYVPFDLPELARRFSPLR